MYIFFTVLSVEPINDDQFPTPISKVYAFCFIKENNFNNVMNKISFSVERADFKILNIENTPQKVIREHFIDEKILLDAYDRCENDGIAIVYNGIAKDGKTNSGPHEIPINETIKQSQVQTISNKIRKIGQCLHYDAGEFCNNLIKAHSIQKSGLLEKISRNGHVYSISTDYADIKRNKGKVYYKLKGINKMSTFLGFCSKHDNELFAPIDNKDLIPDSQQIMLYAYRSLCREIQAKHSGFRKIISIQENSSEQYAVDEMMNGLIIGTYKGLRDLFRHKEFFDNSIKYKRYNDIRYVVYKFNTIPNLAFSGLIFPHYDFHGNLLQNIGNQNLELDLFTFCSAPMENGWGYILAWHESSSNNSMRFYNSIKILSEEQSGEDILFRLAFNIENIGIQPEWWESIEDDYKTRIIDYVSENTDPLAEIRSDYLNKSLEGITDWKLTEQIEVI